MKFSVERNSSARTKMIALRFFTHEIILEIKKNHAKKMEVFTPVRVRWFAKPATVMKRCTPVRPMREQNLQNQPITTRIYRQTYSVGVYVGPGQRYFIT